MLCSVLMQRVCSKPVIDVDAASPGGSGRSSPLKPRPEHDEPASQTCRHFDSAMRGKLNLQPSFWLFFPSLLYGLITSAFLELYVTTASSHLCVFFVGSYCVFSSYFVCDYVMARQSTSGGARWIRL